MLLGLGFGVRCLANLLITPRIHKVEHLIPAAGLWGRGVDQLYRLHLLRQ
ncbi:probable 3-phenylpropionic acid transporter [Photobacterium aphoticum]|uniref:Probable 3-phenylpropionic acid transporter n=1 Tax=Photobacterium aphoticum TaxID=754436 RepID=A0A090RIE6_9GAMM|nr:probable 3-phenylpropionic acid transporter [Photobacterium aphoticum]